MNVQVVTKTEDFDSLKQPWSRLAGESAGTIYQTYEWNRIWWKHFGKEEDLYLILFYEEKQLVGIAPLFRDRVELFGKTVYCSLRFIGSNVSQPEGEPLLGLMAYTDYLDIVAASGYEQQIAAQMAMYLENDHLRYDEVRLEEVPGPGIVHRYLVPALREKEIRLDIDNGSSCVNILIDKSWDEYLKEMKKNTRNNTRGYLKKLYDDKKKIFDLHDVNHPGELPEACDTLARVHQNQWNSLGFPGTYYENRMLAFTKDISRAFFDRGWLKLRKLTPAGRPDQCVAIDLFYTYRKRVYSVIGGMDYQSPLVRKGAGNVIFTDTLKEAFENEFEVFDYLRGRQKYKLRRADDVTTNKNIKIRRSDGKGKLRMSVITTLLNMKRRLRVEFIQFQLFFRDKNMIDGLRSYFSFISDRISEKRNQMKENRKP